MTSPSKRPRLSLDNEESEEGIESDVDVEEDNDDEDEIATRDFFSQHVHHAERYEAMQQQQRTRNDLSDPS